MMGRHKGYTEDDYRRLAEAGLSLSEAARKLGITRQTVGAFAKRHGIDFQIGKRGRLGSGALISDDKSVE